METRNFRTLVETDEHNGGLRITIRLTPYYDGTDATEGRPILDVIERFAPDCFGKVDYMDDDCHISSDDLGLKMQIDVNSTRLLSIDGQRVTSSIGFRPKLIEWEALEDGTSIRWIREAELVEVGPADNETDVALLDLWRRQRAKGCESMMLQHGIRTLTTSYRWSPASDAAIRKMYDVEAR